MVSGVKRTNRLILGDLEMAVLDHLWQFAQGDAKSVHLVVGAKRGITPNTVQSTLERLFRKGLLDREKVSHAYVYKPQVTRTELMAQLIDDVVQPLSIGQTEPLLAAFVEYATRTDARVLDRLEKLIIARRAQLDRE